MNIGDKCWAHINYQKYDDATMVAKGLTNFLVHSPKADSDGRGHDGTTATIVTGKPAGTTHGHWWVRPNAQGTDWDLIATPKAVAVPSIPHNVHLGDKCWTIIEIGKYDDCVVVVLSHTGFVVYSHKAAQDNRGHSGTIPQPLAGRTTGSHVGHWYHEYAAQGIHWNIIINKSEPLKEVPSFAVGDVVMLLDGRGTPDWSEHLTPKIGYVSVVREIAATDAVYVQGFSGYALRPVWLKKTDALPTDRDLAMQVLSRSGKTMPKLLPEYCGDMAVEDLDPLELFRRAWRKPDETQSEIPNPTCSPQIQTETGSGTNARLIQKLGARHSEW